MTDDVLLEEIKTRLSITGTYQDKLLLWYAQDVKNFMLSAGIHEEIVNDEKSIGIICQGVADLWIRNQFSEVFKQRLIQLSMEYKENV